jgi:hypothetical protein
MKKPGAESEEQKRSASAWMFQLAMCFHAALLTMLELALLVMKAGPQNLVLQILRETLEWLTRRAWKWHLCQRALVG